MNFNNSLEEAIQNNFKNVITILELLYKNSMEHQNALNDIKTFLTTRDCPKNGEDSATSDDEVKNDQEEEPPKQIKRHVYFENSNQDNNSENSGELICFDCTQSFTRGTGEFTRHLHSTSCKPYICDVCSKLFKKKSNMITHKLTHSEEVLECDECTSTFKCQKYLDNHKSRIHKVSDQVNTKYRLPTYLANRKSVKREIEEPSNENIQESSIKKTKLEIDATVAENM